MLVKEVFAQTPAPPKTFDDLELMFAKVISSLLALAGIVLFVLIVVGGFKYILSGGNPDAAASARRTITYSIIGLVVIASAYLILVIIREITGAPVTEFII